MSHDPYKNERGKRYVNKICMNCGRKYKGYPSGAVKPTRIERGICPGCKKNDELYGYHEGDYHQQCSGGYHESMLLENKKS